MKYLILIFFIVTSCGDGDDSNDCRQSLVIKNNSNIPVYFNKSNTPEIQATPITLAGDYFKISPNSSKNSIRGGGRGCYQDTFLNNGTLYFTIFDANIVETEDWEYIRENNLYIEQFALTLEDIENLNWIINFTN